MSLRKSHIPEPMPKTLRNGMPGMVGMAGMPGMGLPGMAMGMPDTGMGIQNRAWGISLERVA